MPQVARVFLGGAHDGGYHSPLSALELDGFIDKIVLLRAYDEELPKDLRKLTLKETKFEGLFMEKRLQVNQNHKDTNPASLPRPTSQRGKEREKDKDSDTASVSALSLQPAFCTDLKARRAWVVQVRPKCSNRVNAHLI